MFKFGKFDKQLIAAFCFGVGVIVVSNAFAEVGWFQKPVQCATIEEVNDLMTERNQVPLFAGVGAVRIENTPYAHPFIAFSDPDLGSWHMVEYNIPSNQACVVAVGDQIDFTAPDWFEEQFNRLHD
tara:strand:- start:64 stop:441 length:378 start_codon:yes stop_codon:yes gene_type:complete